MSGTVRRAPRLAPHESIAPHITRVGRFRRVEPTVGRPLPTLMRVLGAVGWAMFLAVSGWRGYRRTREQPE